jgi:hypothetical protein
VSVCYQVCLCLANERIAEVKAEAGSADELKPDGDTVTVDAEEEEV